MRSMPEILLYGGSVVIGLWGIGHIIPAQSVVRGFGPISEDNRRIIMMEWIAAGLTLCFLGVLVGLATAVLGATAPGTRLVARASGGMLIVLAALTSLTGARTPSLPIRMCPVISTAVAIAFLVGAT